LPALSAVLLMLLYLRKRRVEKRGEQQAEVSLSVIQGQEEERRRVAGELGAGNRLAIYRIVLRLGISPGRWITSFPSFTTKPASRTAGN
jgi:signal transduction histidine kinase